ncbi:MAG: 16S rRNA (guanine(527)-N(7))-methyltransferase RsmG [Eggerthellaceae bacterium]|nr:16S rRNA (guanine(527)-N(7))-methyltransferase RsmG [Eggerthellaceae bacterium]
MGEEQMALLERHLDLVMAANEQVNLTRITSREEARVLHIEDSLAGLPEVQAAPVGLLGDMGSGAGFPGIPLSVATGRKTVLIESVGKKAAFLNAFVDELGLAGRVEVFPGRLEELCETRRGGFAVMTARALSQTGSLMELAAPLLAQGGRLVCYKAQPSEEELSHAMELQETLGLAFVSRRDFVLSDGETRRCILVFEKVAKPKVKLPRRPGMAQKKPL